MGRPRGEDREKTTLRLKPRHLGRLRALAENDGVSMTELFDMALEKYLKTRRVRRKGGSENE